MGEKYDDIVDDLDAYMADLGGDIEEEYGDEPPPAPAPPDSHGAEILLRRIARFERKVTWVNTAVDEEIRKANRFRADRTAGLLRQIEFHRSTLEAWMRAVNQLDPKTKTVKLPSGEAKIRPAKIRVVVTDQDNAVVIAEDLDHETWVRTKREISKTDIIDDLYPGDVIAPFEEEMIRDEIEPAPDGYENRAALVLVGWYWNGPVLVPDVVALPNVHLVVPTRPTFGYLTKETRR